MERDIIIKHFNLGDEIEIVTPDEFSSGKLLECSDTFVVIEDADGTLVFMALDNILLCNKKTNAGEENNIHSTNSPLPDDGIQNAKNPLSDGNEIIINDIISTFNEMYEQCAISNDAIIPTNAVVIGKTSQGIEVLNDDGEKFICVKAGFVGYSREKAAVGKRIFCLQNKNNVSYTSITEMSFGEMHNRFLLAANTKPKPCIGILFSILNFLINEFGNSILPQRQRIKNLIKKLSYDNVSTPRIFYKKMSLGDYTTEQKRQIYELLKQHLSELKGMPRPEQIKAANALIVEHLGFQIKRKGEIMILSNLFSDPFLHAPCKINKYYPRYKNGSASNRHIKEIRFGEEVVVENELLEELNGFHFWENDTKPIPAICFYNKTGKWYTATFVTKPGRLSEIRERISMLKSEGRNDLAVGLENYIEKFEFEDQTEISIDLTVDDVKLLKNSKRHRHIKNFEEAEKGFLELMSRGYEVEFVVRELAALYQEWHKVPKAIDILEENLPILEEKVKVYNTLSLLYQSVGEDEKAIDIMEKTISLIPPSSQANEKRISALQQRIEEIRNK